MSSTLLNGDKPVAYTAAHVPERRSGNSTPKKEPRTELMLEETVGEVTFTHGHSKEMNRYLLKMAAILFGIFLAVFATYLLVSSDLFNGEIDRFFAPAPADPGDI